MNMEICQKPTYFNLEEVESIAEEEAIVTLDYTPPVILPEEIQLETDYFSATETHKLENNLVAPSPQSHLFQLTSLTFSPWWWLVSSLGLLLVLMLLVDTHNFIIKQYEQSLFLGTLFLGLTIIMSLAVFILSWQAYQKLQKLRTVSAFQAEGQQLITENGYGRFLPYINRLTDFYVENPEIKRRIEHFCLSINESYCDRDLCSLFSQQVLKDIDQSAYQIVIQRSKETALLLILSPMAFLDTLLTLWRNVLMIQEIAVLYGGKPGFFGSIHLITGVLQNLIYADVSETVADSVSEILGSTLLSMMSAQAAQGVGSAVLTARVGLYAMQACRPVPFLEEEKPRLKEIRLEIVNSLKKKFKK